MATERLLALCAVLAALAAVLVVQRLAGRSGIAAWCVPVAVCVLGIGAVLGTGVGVRRGLALFGIIHLLYLFAVVAVPVTGAGLLLLAVRRGATTPAVLLAVLMLVPAPVGVYATHVAPYLLHVDDQQVPVAAERDRGDAGHRPRFGKGRQRCGAQQLVGLRRDDHALISRQNDVRAKRLG